MNIQPIVFQVPSTPVATPTPAKSNASFLPWIAVAVLVALLAWSQLRTSDVTPGPTPVPVIVDEATAKTVSDASRAYAVELAKVMDDLANKVDAGTIRNWEQLSSNARALSGPARERAFAIVDQLDTAKIPSGDWTENKSVVSLHLRSKAEGHRRASK